MNRIMAKATLSSKGQVTIPARVREALHISRKKTMVGFELVEDGVLIKPLVISAQEENFSESEWDKLEKLSNQEGKMYVCAKDFLTSLEEF